MDSVGSGKERASSKESLPADNEPTFKRQITEADELYLEGTAGKRESESLPANTESPCEKQEKDPGSPGADDVYLEGTDTENKNKSDSDNEGGSESGSESESECYVPLDVLALENEIFDENVRDQLRRYREQLKLYEGFRLDFEPDRNVTLFDRFSNININEDSDFAKDAKKSAEWAINYYNAKRGAKLQFVRLVMAVVHYYGGHEYYVTFDAIDSASGKEKTYQATVDNRLVPLVPGPPMKLGFFRLKPPDKLVN